MKAEGLVPGGVAGRRERSERAAADPVARRAGEPRRKGAAALLVGSRGRVGLDVHADGAGDAVYSVVGLLAFRFGVAWLPRRGGTPAASLVKTAQPLGLVLAQHHRRLLELRGARVVASAAGSARRLDNPCWS